MKPTALYTVQTILDEGCFLEPELLEGLLDSWKRKKNIILQGPPGTGKTWLARRLAFALMTSKDAERLRVVQFHPSLSYEDFVRGWRPGGADGKLALEDGPMLRLVEEARNDPHHDFVLVIEEINRGNTAQIFGEMLTLMESGKRKPAAALALCYPRTPSETVFVPENLYIMGTMNTADRSLALVDHALRRRFVFHTLAPYFSERWMAWMQARAALDAPFLRTIQDKMHRLNELIRSDSTLGPQYCVGHSYVTRSRPIDDGPLWFQQVVDYELRPLLAEYWPDTPEDVDRAVAILLSSNPL